MSKIDWSVLGALKKGLAVEGRDDKTVIESFLDAGEKGGYWSDWRSQLEIISAGSAEKVLDEVTSPADSNPRIWGLIDRDWRTEIELADLQANYPQLLILPRVMIENYCITSEDLEAMLPPGRKIQRLEDEIEEHRDTGIRHGALWQTLYEREAHKFCKGHEDGFPMALVSRINLNMAEIESRFQAWHQQLDFDSFKPIYQGKIEEFKKNKSANFALHIHGKTFFNQIIVQRILNPHLGQKLADTWFSDLFSNVTHCPADIVPVLQNLVTQ